jgi:hypothetical protein
MNKAIPEGGRSVKCARCGHQWRIKPEEPEELSDAIEDVDEQTASGPEQHIAPAEAAWPHSPVSSPQTIGEAWDMPADMPTARETAARSPAAMPAPASTPAGEETIGGAWDVRPGHLAASAIPEEQTAPAPAAQQTIGDAWDVRRGHLAAAIASMGETPADDSPNAGGETPLTAQSWNSATDSADQPWNGEAESADAASLQADHDASFQENDAFAAVARPSWAGSPAWMQNAGETPTGEDDPENSVRQAIRAAIDDENGETGAFALGGGASSISQPVFTEGGSFEDALSGVAADNADLSGIDAPRTDAAERSGRTKPLFASASARADFRADAPQHVQPRAADIAEDATERSENAETFENDIVGIFRQQMQEKRSFGPAPGRKPSPGGFTDYDSGEAAPDQADDRFMADSPLDADAAALQAALEGSLRERHAEEGGSGGLALAAAWAVFLSVLSGVTLAFITFRDEMVVAMPGTAALYRGIGFDVQDRQVDFGPVTYRWTVAEGKPMIEVTGQIINLTDREIAVPRVLVNVHDKANTDTVKATATVRSEPLAAHETADFTLEFLSPPKTISQIELAFAETE